jgi:ribonuclease Z
MELTFLGTTCMVPTKERNHTSILLRFNEEGLLFDCGEGTQRQIKIANHKITEVTKLFITHWHGDHVLGIPGLIQSLGSSQYNGKLKIYGPKGTKTYMKNMLKAFVFDNRVDFEVIEVKKGTFIDTDNYKIEAYELEHGITTLGYKFIEKDRRRINIGYIKKEGIPEGPILGKLQKGEEVMYKGKNISPEKATYIVLGKKIAFMFDTGYSKNCFKIAEDSDVLISDATFASTHEEKADLRGHLTGLQAGQIASQSNVKLLILTHFSTRYKTPEEVENDAKLAFSNVRSAYDFMKLKV